jgi:DNA-binding NarL/FixJ family response regulator
MPVRVLLVDDQASFRRAARAVVEMAGGFEVAGEAETGEASIEVARVLRPDLVLMDVRLPGIDGLEATRRILAAGNGHPVVFLLSTYEPADYAAWVEECGAALSLSKGEFGPDALASAWAAAAGRRTP